MKSKFLGLSAKLALAILAVGTVFASCYDSENGDVTKPYKAPGAVYSFVGTVTNDITGAAVPGAAVSVSGSNVTGNATTDASGAYQIIVKAAEGTGFAGGNVTVTVAASGTSYAAKSVTVATAQLVAGQAATYYNNVIVNYTAFLPEGLKVTSTTSATTLKDVLTGENGENIGLDIMNETNEPLLITRNFIVGEGAIVTNQSPVVYEFTRALPSDVLTAVKNYINADLGSAPTKSFGKKTIPYSILVAPMSALKNVTITYRFEVKSFNFTYGVEKITVTTKRIVEVIFDYSETSFNHYLGHGHGHGHGEDLNAGGGIWE